MSREDAFFAALVNLDEETAIDLCEALLRGGTPRDAIFDVIARAMAQVGMRYERMEYFLAELITAGETVKDVLVKDESGATAIEYGLIAAIVGVGIIAGLSQLKSGLNGLFNTVNTNLT